jgi:hypothetical protein
MENTTKILTIDSGNLIDNVIPLIIKPCKKDSEEWVFVEFPYKHLLPVLEEAS